MNLSDTFMIRFFVCFIVGFIAICMPHSAFADNKKLDPELLKQFKIIPKEPDYNRERTNKNHQELKEYENNKNASINIIERLGGRHYIKGIYFGNTDSNISMAYARNNALVNLALLGGFETILATTINTTPNKRKFLGPIDEFLSDDVDGDERRSFLKDPNGGKQMEAFRKTTSISDLVLLIRTADVFTKIENISFKEEYISGQKLTVATIEIADSNLLEIQRRFEARYKEKMEILNLQPDTK